jgi:16S rRNA (uracil1498-N3)-methyltransferase
LIHARGRADYARSKKTAPDEPQRALNCVTALAHSINDPRVNLILFEPDEISRPLARSDRRAVHVLEVLRRQPGDSIDVGLINGPRGKATVRAVGEDELTLSFIWGDPPPPLDPITVLIGLPRPQTARDVLRELAALGVEKIHFVRTDKTEPSYASSTLWSTGEWRRLLIAGAEQAFDSRLPAVAHTASVEDALPTLPGGTTRLALDNYEAAVALGQTPIAKDASVVLAIGAERGWSERERQSLRNHNFTFAHLGPRVLRVETAAIAAVSILKSKRGSL